MMEIYLNDKQIERGFFGESPPGEILKGLQNELNGEVIFRVRINGREISLEEVLTGSNLPHPMESMEFETQKIENLIAETLSDAQDYLPRLRQGFADSGNFFGQERVEEGCELFDLCLQGLDWYLEALEGILDLFGDGELVHRSQHMIFELDPLFYEIELAMKEGKTDRLAGLVGDRMAEKLLGFVELNRKLISFHSEEETG